MRRRRASQPGKERENTEVLANRKPKAQRAAAKVERGDYDVDQNKGVWASRLDMRKGR